jgi:hypothetical protein
VQTKDIGHDRSETRQIMVCHELGWMDPAIRDRMEGTSPASSWCTATRWWERARPQRNLLLHEQPQRRSRRKLLAYIRGHWDIENRCHWVLDAIYREDHNQTRDRNSAANHSILRRMALNAHNRMPYEGKRRNKPPQTRTARRPRSRIPRTTPLPSVAALAIENLPSPDPSNNRKGTAGVRFYHAGSYLGIDWPTQLEPVFQSWKGVRNSLAHGNLAEMEQHPGGKLIDWYCQMIQAFNAIALRLLGYKGGVMMDKGWYAAVD